MDYSLLFAIVPILALIVDLTLGDPPTAIHPVGWIGWWLFRFRAANLSLAGDRMKFFLGFLYVVFSATATGFLAWMVQSLCLKLHVGSPVISIIFTVAILAFVLKGSLAFKSLIGAGRLVQESLDSGDLVAARHHLSRNLVSRDVSDLSEDAIVSAAVESLAENFVDSLIAPLFWYSILGLPGAWIYRFADTADSILGYRDEEREWLGKTAARLDDILCWFPARLGGGLLVASAALSGLDYRNAAKVMLRDARQCSSPNSGWPMAAAAGALGIRLEKRDTYTLNSGSHSPSGSNLHQVICLLRRGMVLGTILSAGLAGLLLPLVFSVGF